MIKPENYFFSPSAISIELNTNLGHEGINKSETCAVSVAAGSAIRLANELTTKAGVKVNVGYNAQLGYRQFVFTGYNTAFGYPENKYINAAIRVYVRIDASNNASTGTLVFLPYEVDYDGRILDEAFVAYVDIATEQHTEVVGGQERTYYTLANTNEDNDSHLSFYYVHIGTIAAPEDGNRIWEEPLNSGRLDTAKGENEDGTGAWTKMFRLVSGIIELLLPFNRIFFTTGNNYINRITEQVNEAVSDFGSFTEWAYAHTVATTRSVASYVEAKLQQLDGRFFRKDRPDASPHMATFGDMRIEAGLPKGDDASSSGSLAVDGNASVDGNALVKGASRLQRELTFGTEGQTDDYAQNIKGCKIYWDGSGWMVEADYMNIHKKLYAKTIQVDEVTHVGGENILSDASCIADAVIPYTQNGAVVFWRVLFRKKNGEDKTVYNRWKRGDMAYCQVFNVQAGTTSDFENKYYWRKVIGTNIDPNPEIENDSFSSDEYHYIDLSNQTGEYDNAGVMRVDAQAGSIPAAEDPIIQVGYIASPNDDPATVIERQGVTIVSGGGQYKRSILMWEGIGSGTNPWTFPEPKVKLSPYDVRIIANKFLIKTDYGVTYQPPINRGVWANLPPESGQVDNLHRCYKDDIVQHNGSTWICTYIQVSGQPAYTTEEPSDNAVNWQVYAQKGTNADVWTIGQDGYWYKNNVKYTDTDHPNGIVAEGKNGTGVEIKGGVDVLFNADKTSQSQTSLEGLSGVNVGECYTVSANKHLYFYDGTTAASAINPVGWRDLGVFKGEDGVSSYMHVAYADDVTFDAQGNPTSATGFTITKEKEAYAWLGLRTNESIEDPITYTEYEWNKVEGAQGAQGTSAANVNINKPLLGINANAQGQAKQATTLYVRASLAVGSTQDVPLTNVVLSGAPAGVTATWIYQPYTQNAAAIITIAVPLNNSTFPSTLTVTLYGTDPTTGLTRSAQGAITLVAQKDGDNGEDAINPVLSNASTIVVQDISTKNIDLTQAYTDVTLYKGTTDVTSSATIAISATGCSASISGNRVRVTAWGTSQGQYVKEATVRITLTYQSKTYIVDWKLYANLIGTFSEQIQADVKQGIAQSEWWDVDPTTGEIVESQKLGTFIQSSTANIAKLEQTVGDPQNPASGTLAYRTSAIEQHVDNINLSVAEGNRNLHPNPTFANYNPYTNGTNHETGTLVGSVEYGSTIGDYTSIWANEGAQLVALKVLTNTTTAPTVLYAYNSPTANPRVHLTAGKTYTWSVLVAGDLDMIPAASSLVEGSLYNSKTGDQRQSPWEYIRANDAVLWQDTTWKQLYATFEIPANSEYVWFSWIPLIAVIAGATGRIVYGGIRLEEGTKPTIINYSGTEDQLVKTGIDIKNRVIKFNTDNFIVENNQGKRSAWIDRLGNLGTSGNIFTGLTVIDDSSSFDDYFTLVPFDNGDWDYTEENNAYQETEYFRLVRTENYEEGYTYICNRFLIPDIFTLSDIVMFDNALPSPSVGLNSYTTLFLLPFALPKEYDGGYMADVIRTRTNYKAGTPHLLDMTELYMLVGKEFTFMTNQGGLNANSYYFVIPNLKEVQNESYPTYEIDSANPYSPIVFGHEPYVTIRYERLRFKIPNQGEGLDYLYTDGIVPVVKQTGDGFFYNQIVDF